MAKSGRGSDQFPLRLPAGMRDLIKLAAKDSGRSMNQEIIDALREFYPAAPSVGELVDEVEHIATLLEDIATVGGPDTNMLLTLIGRLDETAESLKKSLTAEYNFRSVRLDHDVAERVAGFAREWELDVPSLRESVVNDLVRMSLDRIESREEGFRAVIGEGEERRVVEIIPPWERQTADKK